MDLNVRGKKGWEKPHIGQEEKVMVKLKNHGLTKMRDVDERLVSYNIEMTEVTGGTFWKSYTPEQIAGTEEVVPAKSFTDFAGLMQVYPPVDLYEEKIRTYAKALGSVYIRVSGSWATDTYYDFDGRTGGIVPEGYKSILTKEQWNGVLDFVKAVDAKLLVSVSNCKGNHTDGKPWTPEQAKILFDYSKEYGVPISAAEFMNEPNMLPMDPPSPGYGAAEFGRDQDAFFQFVRENYPEVRLVGPCACGDDIGGNMGGIASMLNPFTSENLLDNCKETADVFSYHSYAGVSDRGAAMGGHWKPEEATSETYLDVVAQAAGYYEKLRDKYCPGAQMWVTETADAGLGGNTWGSTYLDVIRYADELGRFPTMTDGVLFHNTLASSDYGFLDHSTHLPRPIYWVAYLWNHLMGTEVFDTEEEIREGVHLYAHSRKDGKKGYAYLYVNNAKEKMAQAELPANAEVYLLDAQTLRSRSLRINGKTVEGTKENLIPEIKPCRKETWVLEIPPASVAFILV